MTPRRLCALTAALALCLTVTDGAVQEATPLYENYVAKSLSYSALKIGLAERANDLLADGANRLWATTNRGVAAILIDRLAPFFPLTKVSDGLSGDEVAALAFGKLGDEENFFQGYGSEGASGIQYGRVLSDTGLQPKPPASLVRTVTGDPAGVNLINDLAANGESLWAATQGGLVEWVLSGDTPAPGAILLKESPILRVVTDPWAAAEAATVYTSGNSLFAAPSENPFDNSLPSAPVALAFDDDRTLWVATTDAVYRYPAPYDGSTRSGPVRLGDGRRQIRSIAVDPFNPAGTVVWVGTDAGAFFQLEDPATGDVTATGWVQAATAVADTNVKVYVDPSGNLWFGSSFGVRSLLSRLVTISSTRFVGFGARATIDLLDVNPNAPGPAPEPLPDTLTVDIVKPGSTTPELTLTATRQAGTNNYQATFTFAAETVEGQSLGVTSSVEGAVFEVLYRFGPETARRELPRPSFSWANIVKFEDDAWIGGPCFLNALGR